jgi:AcrR family transcriptional regulator
MRTVQLRVRRRLPALADGPAERRWVPRTRNAARYSAQQQRILTEAAELISSQGYASTTMDDLAAAVDMTKAALYYYFANKEDVLLQICEGAVDASLKDLEHMTTDPALSAAERLKAVILQVLTTMKANREVFTVFYQELGRVDHAGTSAIRKKQREYDKRVQEIVLEGMSNSSFRSLPVGLVVFALDGMCNWSYRWLDKPGVDAEEAAAVFSEIFLHGLENNPAVTA